MRVFITDHFALPLPEGHRFPAAKYTLLRKRVMEAEMVAPDHLSVPHAATDEELTRVHTPEYLRRVIHGELTPQEIRRICSVPKHLEQSIGKLPRHSRESGNPESRDWMPTFAGMTGCSTC